jgi:predicted O-methyltransferase YrrM
MLSIDSRRMSLASPDTPLYQYLLTHQPPEHPALRGLRLATQGIKGADMQIGLDQAHFLAFVVKVLGARRVIELGTFTGYSALAMALALPPDGRLITCDVNEAWAAVGRPFWAEAGVQSKIELRLGPALQTLPQLEIAAEPGDQVNLFDLVFIDADKPSYPDYYEAALRLLRPGGVAVLDNMLYLGRVIDPGNQDAGVLAIRELNERIRGDERVDRVMLPIGDGVTLVRRR